MRRNAVYMYYESDRNDDCGVVSPPLYTPPPVAVRMYMTSMKGIVSRAGSWMRKR